MIYRTFCRNLFENLQASPQAQFDHFVGLRRPKLIISRHLHDLGILHHPKSKGSGYFYAHAGLFTIKCASLGDAVLIVLRALYLKPQKSFPKLAAWEQHSEVSGILKERMSYDVILGGHNAPQVRNIISDMIPRYTP